VHFVWQKELNGLGDAISYARDHVGDEPFAVLLGDTLVTSPEPVTRQLMRAYERYRESVVALEEVERSRVSRYGVIAGRAIAESIYLIEDFVEKPSVEDAPSNLVIAGRYVLTPDIFEHIAQTGRGKNDEIQLTDALRLLVAARAVYGLRFEGRRYDIGNKLDFIKTNLSFALMREELRDDLKAFIVELADSFRAGGGPPPESSPLRRLRLALFPPAEVPILPRHPQEPPRQPAGQAAGPVRATQTDVDLVVRPMRAQVADHAVHGRPAGIVEAQDSPTGEQAIQIEEIDERVVEPVVPVHIGQIRPDSLLDQLRQGAVAHLLQVRVAASVARALDGEQGRFLPDFQLT